MQADHLILRIGLAVAGGQRLADQVNDQRETAGVLRVGHQFANGFGEVGRVVRGIAAVEGHQGGRAAFYGLVAAFVSGNLPKVAVEIRDHGIEHSMVHSVLQIM